MGVADVCDDVVRPRVLRDPGSVHRTGEAFLTTVLAERSSADSTGVVGVHPPTTPPLSAGVPHQSRIQPVRSNCAAADYGHRDRIRCHLHIPRSSAPVAGRGGPLPVSPGGLLGAQLQRFPAQRRTAVPRRGQPSGICHRRMRQPGAAGHPRPCGRAGAGRPARRRRAAARRRGHRRRHLPVQEQHRLGRQLVWLP